MGSEQWLHPYCYCYCHHVPLYFVTLLWLVAATFFLKKWHLDLGLFGYNYIKRGDALPSSCLRRAFAPKVDKKASTKRNHHPSYPHLSSFQKSLKYFRRAKPSRNKSGKLSIMHFFCISFVFCFGFV